MSHTWNLPRPEQNVIDGVKWGRCDELFTPAYWRVQYDFHKDYFTDNYCRIGDSLIEEVCACLLGGFGIKAEMALVAFERLRSKKLLKRNSALEKIEESLKSPFTLNGSQVKYRFPIQKAKFIYNFLQRTDLSEIPLDNDLDLRNWLLRIDGIGLKTASWITRNWLGSSNVAIIDIHIYRAGIIAGFFSPQDNIDREYLNMERRYLDFCSALEVNAADMDALIWLQLKKANHIALKLLNNQL